jgi:hypothetical protein
MSVQAIGGTSIVFGVEVNADTFETKCPCRRREEFEDLRACARRSAFFQMSSNGPRRRIKLMTFCVTGSRRIKKMFGLRWLHSDNAFLACFGEHETSRIVCQRQTAMMVSIL